MVPRIKRALITGITGQDGSYLAELLLDKGYEVHGLVRRTSTDSTGRIAHIHARLRLHEGDLSAASLASVIRRVQPDEIYNLAAQSHVGTSFEIPDYTAEVNGNSVLAMLEAIRHMDVRPRIYHASTSELYGSSPPPQSETTPFHPRSPYAVAKLYAYWWIVNYREAYGFHASNGILFNHEGPRRGENFVTRKIARAAARIKCGLDKTLVLGNLDAKRDWGHAKDYVAAMWLMLQQEQPDDYVIATGETHTVREFVEASFGHLGLDWQEYVRSDPRFTRPAEVHALCGDASKAKRVLGWEPRIRFEELVRMMVDAEMTAARACQAVVE